MPTVQNQLVASAATHWRSIGAHLPDDAPGRGDHVLVDLEPRRADPGRRDQARRCVAGDGDDHHLRHDAAAGAAVLRGQSAHDEAADDGGVGRALDQRVAGDQLLAPQVIGQNAVFDRPEQRGDAAEPEQRQIEQGQRRLFADPPLCRSCSASAASLRCSADRIRHSARPSAGFRLRQRAGRGRDLRRDHRHRRRVRGGEVRRPQPSSRRRWCTGQRASSRRPASARRPLKSTKTSSPRPCGSSASCAPTAVGGGASPRAGSGRSASSRSPRAGHNQVASAGEST